MEVDYAPTEEEVQEREDDKPAPTAEFVFAEPSMSEQVFTPLIPPIALGITAFAVVGLVIWAGQRMSHAVGESHYTQAISKEVDYQVPDTEPTGPGAQLPQLAPQGHISVNAQNLALPPVNPALLNGPFIGMETRKAAKASIQPIHDLLDLMHRYDSKGLWNTDNSAATIRDAGGVTNLTTPTDGVAPVTLATPNTTGNFSSDATRGATFQNGPRPGVNVAQNAVADAIVSIDHVHMRADSLSTQTDLVLPPEQFPEPLRPGVKAVSQELHTYLRDADLAATADTATRDKLRREATIRLTSAQHLYDYMNAVIDGTADINNPPRL